MNTLTNPIVQFALPTQLACPKPTEDRGIRRDEVRLMVTKGNGPTYHDVFHQFYKYLQAGEVLVVNTSGMIAAALPVVLPGGARGMLHLSTQLHEHQWLAEIREIRGNKTERWRGGQPGMVFHLPHGGSFVLDHRFYKEDHLLDL